MREVEAQAIGRHQRAALIDLAEHLAQREVEHVRARVVVHHAASLGRVHVELDGVADAQRGLVALQRADVEYEAASHLHIVHNELELELVVAARCGRRLLLDEGEIALVEGLAALLGIEVGAIEKQTARLARLALVDELLVAADRFDGGRALAESVVASGGGRGLVERVVVLGRVVGVQEELGVELVDGVHVEHDVLLESGGDRLRLGLRRLLGLLVGELVDAQAGLLAHELAQIERKAVRVVQAPRHLARKDAHARVQLGDRLLEQALAARQRLEELRLLFVDHVLDVLRVLAHLGKRVAEQLDDHVDELGEEARLGVELLDREADAATQYATEHVAAADVVRSAAVADRHDQRADVVGDHAIRHVHFVHVVGAHLARVRPHARSLLIHKQRNIESKYR